MCTYIFIDTKTASPKREMKKFRTMIRHTPSRHISYRSPDQKTNKTSVCIHHEAQRLAQGWVDSSLFVDSSPGLRHEPAAVYHHRPHPGGQVERPALPAGLGQHRVNAQLARPQRSVGAGPVGSRVYMDDGHKSWWCAWCHFGSAQPAPAGVGGHTGGRLHTCFCVFRGGVPPRFVSSLVSENASFFFIRYLYNLFSSEMQRRGGASYV